MYSQQQTGSRHGILSLTIKDAAVLYAAYMPFLENGGLFIPTTKAFEIGDEVFMLLNLMEESEKIPVTGTVVWITPENSQSRRAPGIGVQFNDRETPARSRIEACLGAGLGGDRATHTM